jgi:hypothetical protein
LAEQAVAAGRNIADEYFRARQDGTSQRTGLAERLNVGARHNRAGGRGTKERELSRTFAN